MTVCNIVVSMKVKFCQRRQTHIKLSLTFGDHTACVYCTLQHVSEDNNARSRKSPEFVIWFRVESREKYFCLNPDVKV